MLQCKSCQRVNLTPHFSCFLQDLGDNGSGVVQTSWAILGLLACECPNKQAVDRGVQYIMSKQVGLFGSGKMLLR